MTLKPTYASAGETVAYGYDHANRLVSRVHDATPGVAGGESRTVYVFSGGQVVLQFEGPGATLTASNLAHRYLWGPAVDQLLADEQVDWANSQADGDTLWAMTDHLGTVRDLVDDTGVVVNHLAYDAFGAVLSATSTVATTDFGYTGKLFDATVGLQNNWNRWYDARVGKWISEDPIGFEAGDANLGRYVNNATPFGTDPEGLFTIGIGYGFDIHIIWVHVAVEVDVTIGFDPFTGNADAQISTTSQVGTGPGLGASAGPHITVTTNPLAGDLDGAGREFGVWAGTPVGSGGFGIMNDRLTWFQYCHQILFGFPRYHGGQIALPIGSIGFGAGLYDDQTFQQPIIHINRDGVQFMPNPNNT